MIQVNKSWDKLQCKLGEREAHLKDILDLSTQYYDALQKLSEWLPEITDKMDTMPAVATQPEVVQQQKEDVRKMEEEVENQQTTVDDAAKLCKELCEFTKEGSTKFDLKNKLGSVEKPFNDIKKKLGKWSEMYCDERSVVTALIELLRYNLAML